MVWLLARLRVLGLPVLGLLTTASHFLTLINHAHARMPVCSPLFLICTLNTVGCGQCPVIKYTLEHQWNEVRAQCLKLQTLTGDRGLPQQHLPLLGLFTSIIIHQKNTLVQSCSLSLSLKPATWLMGEGDPITLCECVRGRVLEREGRPHCCHK